MEENNHIYPIFDKMLMRKDKEDLLKQHMILLNFFKKVQLKKI